MAAPSNLPPLPPIDSTGPLFLGFDEPPPPPFIADLVGTGVQTDGQNYDRHDYSSIPPPPAMADLLPPPQAPDELQQIADAIDGTAEQTNTQHQNRPRRDSHSDDESSSEHASSEEEDERTAAHNQWRAVEEDKSVPCKDELAYISSREEHSAVDHSYWEKETFFDPDDPEITPIESGRIDWLVEKYNGTKDGPNLESIMRSPIISIGGCDWRIKFYPKGNNTDYLSVYLECVTMQSSDFEETTDDLQPALPFLAGLERPKKRRSVAVQLSVIMYNPAEPRTYEHQMDAHQFYKKSADYGWTRFTRYPRRDFVFRNHGQRQAILRNDKLAFTAHIRVVNDPTGCLWAHGSNPYEDSLALTGLRPFSPQDPIFAAELPLLHFAPFRDFVYRCGPEGKIGFWFQTLLWKMMSRRRSQKYGVSGLWCSNSDSVAWLRYAVRWLGQETDRGIVNDLIGSCDAEFGAIVGANRLKTKHLGSVQAAVDAHPTPIAKPALLTLELERQEYERPKRSWTKITNKVEMQDRIVVSGTPYTLFAFSTHCGDLTSNRFNVYIRPNGPDNGWYAYTDGNVTRLTHKQAVEKHCGYDVPTSPAKQQHYRTTSRLDPACRGIRRLEEHDEVAHVVHYVRDDCAFSAFAKPVEETWDAPDLVRKGKLPQQEQHEEPPMTAVNERFPIQEEAVVAEEALVRKSSFSSSAGAETPNCWLMDGDDVVMTDATTEDSASVYANDDPTAPTVEEVMRTQTMEFLGREYYKGQMLGPKYHGEGHQICMNGDEYIGTFHLGERSGRGTITYGRTSGRTGDTYSGEWLEDQHHGTGVYTEAKTGNVYEGSWKHGRKSGSFLLKGTVTEDDKGCCSICYDREISTAFYDCGHVVACKECANRIDSCPVCRKRVLARLELFGVKMTFE